MSSSHCLNCGQTIHSKFCPDCGQKTDTHRIVLKHFLLHDMLHGVWHLERGILFTIKEAIVRPGRAALDYISGKRIRYYNVFYLCLLVIGFNLLLGHYLDSFSGTEEEHMTGADAASQRLADFFDHYLKFILLGIVPIISFSAYVVFRRLKLNLAEHFIIGGICLLGKLVICTFMVLTNFVTTWLPDFMNYFIIGLAFVVFLWPIWVYWNAMKGHYKVLEYAWRIFVFYLLSLILMIIALTSIMYAVTGTGEVNFNTGPPTSAHSAVSTPPSS